MHSAADQFGHGTAGLAADVRCVRAVGVEGAGTQVLATAVPVDVDAARPDEGPVWYRTVEGEAHQVGRRGDAHPRGLAVVDGIGQDVHVESFDPHDARVFEPAQLTFVEPVGHQERAEACPVNAVVAFAAPDLAVPLVPNVEAQDERHQPSPQGTVGRPAGQAGNMHPQEHDVLAGCPVADDARVVHLVASTDSFGRDDRVFGDTREQVHCSAFP